MILSSLLSNVVFILPNVVLIFEVFVSVFCIAPEALIIGIFDISVSAPSPWPLRLGLPNTAYS
jgi:hypothetical protein